MNLNQTFSILFWINKSKVNKDGFAPIWARVTVDGKRSECSVKRQILIENWDAEKGRAKVNSENASIINDHLLQVEASITKHYNILLTTKDYVTADDVKKSFQGVKELKKTMLQLFDQYLSHLKERKEIGEISDGRLKRFEILHGKCSSFIKVKFKRTDVVLEEVKLNFIMEFQQYLRSKDLMGHNTSMKYSKDLRQVMKYAVSLEHITSNPFTNFRCSNKNVMKEILNANELKLLYEKKFSIARLEEVRDCYIFCCYTGYAYSDAESLKPENVSIGIDGNKWIIRNRKKTDVSENVPLLPIPLVIIEKYKNHPQCLSSGKLLPMNSNQRFNAYLKEVADLCGIKKNLTTHTARHTFATTVTLSNGVPIETVSRLLGHKSIRTTQIYAKVIEKKISDDMNVLKERLSQVS